jgi:hypothetical protein
MDMLGVACTCVREMVILAGLPDCLKLGCVCVWIGEESSQSNPQTLFQLQRGKTQHKQCTRTGTASCGVAAASGGGKPCVPFCSLVYRLRTNQ